MTTRLSYCAACEGLHPVIDGKMAARDRVHPCKRCVGLSPADCLDLRSLVAAIARREEAGRVAESRPEHHAIADDPIPAGWTLDGLRAAILRAMDREREVADCFLPGDGRRIVYEEALSAVGYLIAAARKAGAR